MDIPNLVQRLLLFGVVCLVMSDAPPARGSERFDGMDAYVCAALKKWQIPGLAIAVVKDGEVVLARGYGLSKVGTEHKVTDDTDFHIASAAKPLLATAVAMLVEERKVRWDDPVKLHIPEFELADPYLTEHVTLRDLLCHRTGLRRADLLAYAVGFDSEEVLLRLKYLEPIADLRTQLIYNNHMYTVLGEVARRVSGEPWEQFVAKRIFQPLKMKSTTSEPTTIDSERLALRHWRSDEGIVARPVDQGIYSTARDMAQWLKLQLSGGAFEGRQLLRPETVREMHALQFSIPVSSRPKNNVYAAQFIGSGLGWNIQDYRGRKVVSHGGSWGAMVAMMPEEGLGVVVLSNLDLEHLCALLMYDIFDAYLVGPGTAWNPDKWGTGWLRNEPPGAAYLPRDEAKARLEKVRAAETLPSLPLEKYAGRFDSTLYGSLVVRHDRGRLTLTFAGITTDLSHWQDDSFYVRAPTRLNFDWLLTFSASKQNEITHVTVKHIGGDKDEKDHVYVRGN